MTVSLPSGKNFILANTHMDAQRSDDTRTLQMKAILNEFKSKTEPIVFCGDFNSVDTSEAIRLLDEQFKRTCTQNCPGTIPVINPAKTIDYITIKNAGWYVKDYLVIPEIYASDHRPVVVTFKMDR
jgi:endonuclease/exonuclease/phosphatase (EEP) superfamily protein YafD